MHGYLGTIWEIIFGGKWFRPIDFFLAVFVAVAPQHYTILYFV